MRVHNSQKSNKGEVPLGTKWPPKKGVGKRGRRRLSGKLNKIKDIHPCAYCGKLFSNRRALGGHIRTHRNQGDHLVIYTTFQILNEYLRMQYRAI